MSRTRSPSRGGFAAIALSPCSPTLSATMPRYLIQTSKSGPFQASVASVLSSTTRIASVMNRKSKPAGFRLHEDDALHVVHDLVLARLRLVACGHDDGVGALRPGTDDGDGGVAVLRSASHIRWGRPH